MTINGRRHDMDCGSGGGPGTNAYGGCQSVLCAGCDSEIPVSLWPSHQAFHPAAFCYAKGGPTPCRLLKGHSGAHLSALRLALWPQAVTTEARP
jgi:hypothetical protein